MGTAADLLGTRPVVLPPTSGFMAGSGPGEQKIQVLPGTVFEVSVAGVAQKFQLGVLDSKMVILRNNPAGGNFVLRTDVPAGGQPKQVSDRTIARFTEMVRSPSAETTNFLRTSGALIAGGTSQPSPLTAPKVKTALLGVTVASSFFSRANGSDAFAVSAAVQTGRGKDNIRFERISANNVNGNQSTSNSAALTYGLGPNTDLNTDLIGAVSTVRNENTRSETTSLGLAVRTNLRLNQFALSAEARLIVNPQTGAVTFRPTVSAIYTIPLKNGVDFYASVAARVPIPFGSTPGGVQSAASFGIGYKTDTFIVRALVGTVFAGDAVNLNSASGPGGFGGGINVSFRF
jgi:hypothetical protein